MKSADRGELGGNLSLFFIPTVFPQTPRARVDQVDSYVALEGGEIDQPLAVQFECGDLLADRLDGDRSRLLDRLPHFLQDTLNILRKCLDVFVDRLVLRLVLIHVSHPSPEPLILPSAQSQGGRPWLSGGSPVGPLSPSRRAMTFAAYRFPAFRQTRWNLEGSRTFCLPSGPRSEDPPPHQTYRCDRGDRYRRGGDEADQKARARRRPFEGRGQRGPRSREKCVDAALVGRPSERAGRVADDVRSRRANCDAVGPVEGRRPELQTPDGVARRIKFPKESVRGACAHGTGKRPVRLARDVDAGSAYGDAIGDRVPGRTELTRPKELS